MRAAINGMALGQMNGTGRYTRELLVELIPILEKNGDELDILVPEGLECPPGPWTPYLVPITGKGAHWHYYQVPRYLNLRPYDVYHDPCHFHPKKTKTPAVVTIHDLACYEKMTWCTAQTTTKFRIYAKKTVKLASIIVPSRFTADRVSKILRYDLSTVIPHGGDHISFDSSKGSCLVNIGVLTNRKGRKALFAANKRGDIPNIRYYGAGKKISDEELAAAYGKGVALISLSQYEGFGIHVLEAARNGLPVIANPLPPYKEILGGDYPMFIRHDSLDDLADYAARLRDDDVWRVTSERCRKASGAFTWSESAKTTYEVYERVARK